MNATEFYINNFSVFEKELNGDSENFLHELRKQAVTKLGQLSFPTLKNEEWKYTDVTPITKQNFLPAKKSSNPNPTKEEIGKFLFKDFEYHLLVFVNGLFSEELSNVSVLPKGITVGSLRKIAKENPELIKKFYNGISKHDNAFNAINSAYAVDGYVVVLPDQKILEKPIQVLFLNTVTDESILSVPRNLVVMGKNSQASIITNYQGLGNKSYFSNIVTEIYVDEEAVINLYKMQNELDNSYHIEKVQAHQKSKSTFNHYNILFGGEIIRNDINSVLDGEFIETHYYGLALANGKQHMDNHTFVDHAKPNCMSNELYKSILDENARGVFNGKIIVRRDAQKTNAYQQNKTILLSKTAKIDTKPQLEIFADDVKCSHGATVGHLDESSEFYIRSRGVPQELAKSMLIRAFANDVIENVKIEPLREQLNHMIFEHLHKTEIQNQ